MPQTFPLLPIALGSALLLTACRPTPSTPLTSAAFRGDAAEVTTLLKTTSADTAADAWSPLIWAARAGRVEVMTLLLDAGADPNRRDTRRGWTPLMHAQHAKQRSAAQLLLTRGADGASGSGGTSPMEMAALDNDVRCFARCWPPTLRATNRFGRLPSRCPGARSPTWIVRYWAGATVRRFLCFCPSTRPWRRLNTKGLGRRSGGHAVKAARRQFPSSRRPERQIWPKKRTK